jgi:endonuclease III
MRTGRSGWSIGRAASRRRARRATEVFAWEYGSPDHGNKEDPMDELVYILLSVQTSHRVFLRVYEKLKAACPSWDTLASMDLRKLRRLIADAGLADKRARALKRVAQRIRDDFDVVSLDALRELDDCEAEAYLSSLPGVGTKVAKCVLMYSLGRPVLPVDTHVWRVGIRLGLVDPAIGRSDIHEAFEDVVAPEERYAFHVNALAHGREVCRPEKPRCDRCVVRRMCRNPGVLPKTR